MFGRVILNITTHHQEKKGFQKCLKIDDVINGKLVNNYYLATSEFM